MRDDRAEATACDTCGGCVLEDHDAGFVRVACPACSGPLLVEARVLAGVVVEACPMCKATLELRVEPAPVRVPIRFGVSGRVLETMEASSIEAASHWDPRAWHRHGR
ncbi:MAG: hypothetical protein WD598_16375 [Acidimicrobiia bacterium]